MVRSDKAWFTHGCGSAKNQIIQSHFIGWVSRLLWLWSEACWPFMRTWICMVVVARKIRLFSPISSVESIVTVKWSMLTFHANVNLSYISSCRQISESRETVLGDTYSQWLTNNTIQLGNGSARQSWRCRWNWVNYKNTLSWSNSGDLPSDRIKFMLLLQTRIRRKSRSTCGDIA